MLPRRHVPGPRLSSPRTRTRGRRPERTRPYSSPARTHSSSTCLSRQPVPPARPPAPLAHGRTRDSTRTDAGRPRSRVHPRTHASPPTHARAPRPYPSTLASREHLARTPGAPVDPRLSHTPRAHRGRTRQLSPLAHATPTSTVPARPRCSAPQVGPCPPRSHAATRALPRQPKQPARAHCGPLARTGVTVHAPALPPPPHCRRPWGPQAGARASTTQSIPLPDWGWVDPRFHPGSTAPLGAPFHVEPPCVTARRGSCCVGACVRVCPATWLPWALTTPLSDKQLVRIVSGGS